MKYTKYTGIILEMIAIFCRESSRTPPNIYMFCLSFSRPVHPAAKTGRFTHNTCSIQLYDTVDGAGHHFQEIAGVIVLPHSLDVASWPVCVCYQKIECLR